MNTDIIKVFLSRVKAATSSRSEEIRISTHDAQLLAATIGELLAGRVAEQSGAPRIMSVEMDGGPLDKSS